MKEHFVSGEPNKLTRDLQRIGLIFTNMGTGRVMDICECDPLPRNFSMMSRFLKMWEGCTVEAYVTSAVSCIYSERHDLIRLVPQGCRLSRLCVVKDGKAHDLEKWFFDKCRELHPSR